ncbi:fibronectin type III domain-containing protein [Planobispora takensis]|uniref:fibronectin type III domain-containing protein n=1 Tax=Planobispora takensis TaxID=1367882 RepID=UPI00366DC9CA
MVTLEEDAAPGAPFITDVYPRDGAVRVSWSPPATGTSGLSGYVVQASPGTAAVTVSASASEAIVTGLSNGTAYTFTVKAVNGAGEGAASWPSNPVAPQPARVPLRPANVQAFALDRRIEVQWVPVGDGGAPITGYVLTAQPGDITVSAPAEASTAALTGLANGTAYSITVVARNAAGVSKPSTIENITPAASRPPAAPTRLQVGVPSTGTAEVSWQAPADRGTSAITGYTVTASPGGRSITTTAAATAATFTGLDPALAYTFTVRAASAAGTGAASIASSPVTPKATIKQEPVQLSAAALASLREVRQDGTLVFANPPAQVTGLKNGDILLLSDAPQAPEGFLGKVVGSAASGDGFVVHTVASSLDEMFTDVSFAADISPDNSDEVHFTAAQPGVRLAQPQAAAAGPNGAPTVFIRQGGILVIDLAWIVRDKGRTATQISGWVTIDPTFRIGISPYHVGTEQSVKLSSEMRLDHGFRRGFTEKLTLGVVKGPCVKIPLPRGKTTVCTRFYVSYTVSGEVSVGLSYAAHWDKEFGTRCTITKTSTGCDVVKNTGEGFWLDNCTGPSVVNCLGLYGDGQISTGIETDVAFMLEGRVGPALTVKFPHFQLKMSTTQNPWCELKALAGLGAAIDVRVIGKTYSPWRNSDLIPLAGTSRTCGDTFQGLKINPQVGQVEPSQSLQLTTAVSGYPDDVTVRWSVRSGPGTITEGGRYTAPASAGVAEIEAVSPATGGHPELRARAAVEIGTYGTPSPPRSDDWSRPGHRSLTVSWRRPEYQGASAIKDYAVVVQRAIPYGPYVGPPPIPDDTKTIYAPSTATHVLAEDLAPGATYRATIYARNANGISGPSETLLLTTVDLTFPAPPIPGIPQSGTKNIVTGAETPRPRPDTSGWARGVVSGDGRYVIYLAQGRSNTAVAPVASPGNYNFYLFRKDMITGERIVVSKDLSGAPVPAAQVFAASRDASAVAFLDSGGTLIVHRITAGTSWNVGSGLSPQAVSSNGEVVLYRKQLAGTAKHNMFRHAAGAAAQQLDHTCTTGADDQDCAENTASMSDDGAKVVYGTLGRATSGYQWRIWLLDAAGARREITSDSVVPRLEHPIISGDGSTIAANYTWWNSSPASAPLISGTVVKRLGSGPIIRADIVVPHIEDTSGQGGSTYREWATPTALSRDGRVLAYHQRTKAGPAIGESVNTLRVYRAGGLMHIAGGSPLTEPLEVSLTDDGRWLVYSLTGALRSGLGTIPGVWQDDLLG